MKDLGQLHHFLGMHVQRRPDGFLLSQHQYMLDILARAGMTACKPCTTPVDTNPKLSAIAGTPLSASEASDFRSLAGACSTSHSLGRILPTLFSRSASICMLLGTFTWLH
jgi:hypothetical protein